MGKMMFGTTDELSCLTQTWFEGPNGEQVCLASKISLHFFVAGVHVSDGGYVLKIKDQASYYPLSSAQLASLAQAGLVPDPPPAYRISWGQYAIGYSLWLVIAWVLLLSGVTRLVRWLRPSPEAMSTDQAGGQVIESPLHDSMGLNQ